MSATRAKHYRIKFQVNRHYFRKGHYFSSKVFVRLSIFYLQETHNAKLRHCVGESEDTRAENGIHQIEHGQGEPGVALFFVAKCLSCLVGVCLAIGGVDHFDIFFLLFLIVSFV